MAPKEKEIEDIKSTPIEIEDEGGRKGVNFLSVGKYFLILLVIFGQVFLAYSIVDNNYEQIYLYLKNNASGDNVTYGLEELVVNPSGTNGQRFLVIEISLELTDKDHIEKIKQNEQKIKHNMIEAISARTVDQLINFEERELLRKELADITNNAIGIRSVRNLYYTRYVMQ